MQEQCTAVVKLIYDPGFCSFVSLPSPHKRPANGLLCSELGAVHGVWQPLQYAQPRQLRDHNVVAAYKLAQQHRAVRVHDAERGHGAGVVTATAGPCRRPRLLSNNRRGTLSSKGVCTVCMDEGRQ